MAPSRFIAIFSSDSLLELAHKLSPRVEIYPPNGIILEVPVRYEQDTLNRLSHVLDCKDIQVGGAFTRTTAIFAAKIKPGTFVPYGKEAQLLSSLPISALSIHTHVEESVIKTLSQWGIKTLGELSALPQDSLIARIGQCGVLLQKLARGEDSVQFEASQPATEFKETLELEWTLNNLEALAFTLGGILESLCERIHGHGLAAEEIQIHLGLEDQSVYERSIRLALPMQNPKVILSLVRLDLQSHPPQSGINTVSVQIRTTRPRFFQHSLLHPTSPQPEKLSRTLTRLQALVGSENLGSPSVVDTHRPDTFQLRGLSLEPLHRTEKPDKGKPRSPTRITLSLRRLRPPRPMQVQTEDVVSCAGPWKSSGDWWREGGETDGWSREEWDVELSDGGIYRIYWDHREKNWFMEGIYD